jgi:hypothetical protein
VNFGEVGAVLTSEALSVSLRKLHWAFKADFHRSYLADENYDSFISFLKEPMKIKKAAQFFIVKT